MDIEAQLKPLTQAGRLGFLIKKLTSGEITRQEYDRLLYISFDDTNPVVDQTAGEVRDDIGEQRRMGDWQDDNGLQKDDGVIGESEISHAVEPVSTLLASRNKDGRDTTEKSTTHTDTTEGTSQKDRLLTMLADYRWHTTPEIQVAVYGANHLGVARIGARVQDLRDDGHTIESEKVTKSIWQYRLIEKNVRWVSENISSG
jgi:hypothetical protein